MTTSFRGEERASTTVRSSLLFSREDGTARVPRPTSNPRCGGHVLGQVQLGHRIRALHLGRPPHSGGGLVQRQDRPNGTHGRSTTGPVAGAQEPVVV